MNRYQLRNGAAHMTERILRRFQLNAAMQMPLDKVLAIGILGTASCRVCKGVEVQARCPNCAVPS